MSKHGQVRLQVQKQFEPRSQIALINRQPNRTMRMRNVTILNGGWAVQMDFLFENCTFLRKSKRITIPDQSYYNLPEKKL